MDQNYILPIAEIVLKVKEHKLLTPFEELKYLTIIKGLSEQEALTLLTGPNKVQEVNHINNQRPE